MKIEYIRKLMTSHMILESAGNLAVWEEKMIAHAAGENVLFAECVREDGVNRLWYDITGKQSIETLLETEELGFELLGRILTGIYEVQEELERVLLRPDAVLLIPECIFTDYRTGQMMFCYYPGNEEGIAEAFLSLMEYLLSRLDHKDERAVELAYKIYEEASGVKGEGSLGEFKNLLRMPYEREDAGETDKAVEEWNHSDMCEAHEPEEKMQDFDIESESGQTRQRMSRSMRGLRLPEIRKLEQWKDFFREKVKGFFPNGEKPVERSLHMDRVKRRKVEEETFVFEPEEETRTTLRPTVLLSELAKTPEGILRYEGSGNQPDLVIRGESYVIGSEPECEGYIKSSTVSRKHARIIRKEDIFFIEDLNSSNGTYVGGELLNYKTKVSLQKNEIVLFADEKFRFI